MGTPAPVKMIDLRDYVLGLLEPGTSARLRRPTLHCEGWGHQAAGTGTHACDGGPGLLISRRARWIRADGILQCGTCHRRETAQEA